MHWKCCYNLSQSDGEQQLLLQGFGQFISTLAECNKPQRAPEQQTSRTPAFIEVAMFEVEKAEKRLSLLLTELTEKASW